MLCALFCTVLLSGCTLSRAWFQTDYLGGTINMTQALTDINDYIAQDSASSNIKSSLAFTKQGTEPLIGLVYTNDFNMELWFELDGNFKITSIGFTYVNTDPQSVEAAKILTAQISSIISPMDYAFNADNRRQMLSHLNLGSFDFGIVTFMNSNDTRVEKIADNAIGIPLTLVRFSKTSGKSLETFTQEIGMKFLNGGF